MRSYIPSGSWLLCFFTFFSWGLINLFSYQENSFDKRLTWLRQFGIL